MIFSGDLAEYIDRTVARGIITEQVLNLIVRKVAPGNFLNSIVTITNPRFFIVTGGDDADCLLHRRLPNMAVLIVSVFNQSR